MKSLSLSLAMVGLMAGLAAAQATRPARDRNPESRFGERIQHTLAQLNLTDDQKQKINDILEQARQDFQSQMPVLRQATPEMRRKKVQEMLEGVREEIADLLTPEQRQQVQKLIQKRVKDNPQLAKEMRDRAAKVEEKQPPAIAPKVTESPRQTSGSVPQVGDVAPDVSLRWLDGQPVELSTFKGNVMVLVFGSYTTPVFRDKASELRAVAQKYANRAKFVIVYTREAHPSNGWTVERNQRDNIEIAQPTNEAGRKAIAEQARTALHLEDVPMALDTMSDATATAYGAFPDGVVVIGKDGKIAARENWLDPTALPRFIEAANNAVLPIAAK
jgi:Spy/CpxP family protein refolding chaperone/peroxiredoxin